MVPAFGKGRKAKAMPKPAAPAKASGGGRRGSAPASKPMAPPALAPKMRGMAKMPAMMRKGGKVTAGCK